jgi:hypothetical protein
MNSGLALALSQTLIQGAALVGRSGVDGYSGEIFFMHLSHQLTLVSYPI